MAHHTANSFLLASSLATDKKTDKTMRGLQPPRAGHLKVLG
jgi:hypothetical protein